MSASLFDRVCRLCGVGLIVFAVFAGSAVRAAAPEKPAVEKPAPEKPAPEKPAPEKPAPEKPAVEKPAVDQQAVLRYDPIDDTLKPVPADELKVGYIYNHFDAGLKRRVWSYLQADHQFWFALGEGTTLEAWRLDIRATAEEAYNRLRQLAPDLARGATIGARPVFFRLEADGRWQLDRSSQFPCMFNVQTGQRWEWHNEHYIPVIHLCGDRWAVVDGKYVAVP